VVELVDDLEVVDDLEPVDLDFDRILLVHMPDERLPGRLSPGAADDASISAVAGGIPAISR
jgi:hypothetical protein